MSEVLAIEVEQLLPGGHSEQLVELEEVYRQLPIRSMKDIQIDGWVKRNGLEDGAYYCGEVLQALNHRIT